MASRRARMASCSASASPGSGARPAPRATKVRDPRAVGAWADGGRRDASHPTGLCTEAIARPPVPELTIPPASPPPPRQSARRAWSATTAATASPTPPSPTRRCAPAAVSDSAQDCMLVGGAAAIWEPRGGSLSHRRCALHMPRSKPHQTPPPFCNQPTNNQPPATWTGATCKVPHITCGNSTLACMNGGECVLDESVQDWFCHCPPNLRGRQCQLGVMECKQGMFCMVS
jgi:hypothetical protein